MKKEKELPFTTLMAYADGSLPQKAAKNVESFLTENPESRKIVEGLQAIYDKEQLDAVSLELAFAKSERQLEKEIYLHSNFSTYFIELNRQLRMAAAVFALIISSSLLMGFASTELPVQGTTEQHGPYDLASGSKIAP